MPEEWRVPNEKHMAKSSFPSEQLDTLGRPSLFGLC